MIINNGGVQRLSGFYRGKVLKHLSHGKCKIFIYEVYDSKYNSFDQCDGLPDAEQISPLFGGSNAGNGVFSYPNLGSTVICGFWNEDQNLPFFFGSTLGDQDTAGKQYTDVSPRISNSDFQKKGDDCRVHKITVDHSVIKIWESGKIQIKTFTDRKNALTDDFDNTQEGCCIDLDHNGNVNIRASNQIHLDTNELTIDAHQMTINSPLINTHSRQLMEIDTGSLKVDVESETKMNSPLEEHTNTHTFRVESPSIKLDGHDGTVSAISKNHFPMFL